MSYYVYITQKGRFFVAEVPALPGCRTLGRSEREVLDNIKSVVQGYLKTLRMKHLPVPRVKVIKVREQELAAFAER